MDTIFALASAPGKAGVAVIRVSGPRALKALGGFGATVPANGRGLRRLKDEGGAVIDEALILHFAEGASFTGEEVVELQVHGSPAVISKVLKSLGDMPGLKAAEPGEFTRRAFDNGRLDLAQVEGLSDLIEAETEAQRSQAIRVLNGDLGKKAQKWKTQLRSILAALTAGIDFADEEIPSDVTHGVADEIQSLITLLETEVTKGKRAESIRSGFEVAIVGPPNAGKSTLLNRLAGREAAITSEVAGTTRDVIEVRMDLGGLPVTLLDTAGMRETDDEIEAVGVARAVERAKAADLRVFLVDGDWQPADYVSEDDIIVRAKSDLTVSNDAGVSGLTGQGVDALVTKVETILTNRAADAGLAVRERHRLALQHAILDLNEARVILLQGDDAIATELLMSATRALDSLIGLVDVESILGDIFSKFCIGK